MRALVVADLHYALKQFDWLQAEVDTHDLLIIAGDLLELASAVPRDIQVVVMKKLLQRLRTHKPLLVCSGNHDPNAVLSGDERTAQWLQEARSEGLWVDGDSIEVDKVGFSILPCWEGDIGKAAAEAQLERDAAKNWDPWVWVYHYPPQESPVSWNGRMFTGDKVVIDWIKRYRPYAVLGGHVHQAPFYPDGAWKAQVDHTWVFNAGKQPGPEPTRLSIDFARQTAEWTSCEGREAVELRAS